MALSKIQSESINLADTFAFTGTVSGAGGGKVLQVKSVSKDTYFSTTSTTFTDVTGMSVSITPSSASSKIYCIFHVGISGNGTGGQYSYMRLMRDSTAISVGDISGSSRVAVGSGTGGNVPYDAGPLMITHLDSPSTTSAITYKIQMKDQNSGTAKFNARGDDGDNDSNGRSAASLTVMEISG
mgnify:CR=1 FL=1